MYEVYLMIGEHIVAEILFKSITQVAKFLNTVDFHILNVDVYSPKHVFIDPMKICEVWNA